YIDPGWDSLKIYYEYGFRNRRNEALGFYVFFHYAEGDTWSSSQAYRLYSSSSSGFELINLSDTLYNGHNPGTGAVERPDSLQIAWIYFDNGEWGWAAAVDSVNLFAIDTSVGTITEGVLLTPPVAWYDLIKEDPSRTSWIGVKIRKGSAQDSIGIQIEYKESNSWSLVPDADLGWTNSSPHFDMSSDFNAVSIPFDGSVYDTLRLRLTFRSGTKASPTPVLKEIGIGSVSGAPTGIHNPNKPYRFLFTLKQNILRDNLTIEYEIPQETKVNIKVYDVSGRTVAEVFSGKKKPGVYSIQWQATAKTGKALPPGIYFLRFEAGKNKLMRKIIKVQ
ncbi:MAG TPA: T9SS type A sorting domain-containing protein, partial [candidate division WOR-3 bacterium]|nr:T9SS type A sorting domain-containing protein [candidate division WOR-3 bacterium]